MTVRLRGRNCNPRKLKFSAVCNSIRRFNATAVKGAVALNLQFRRKLVICQTAVFFADDTVLVGGCCSARMSAILPVLVFQIPYALL